MSKRVVILGSGESGVGAAVLAQAKGFDVFVSDKGLIKEKYRSVLQEKNIPFEEGTHTEEKILNAGEIIKSPGIPDKAELIKKAKAKGIKIISEIEFAGRYTNAKKICITGSNGKTTTTLLTYHILQNAGYNVGLAGNIGKSLALQVATGNFDYYVIELSSFQLDDMVDFKAEIAILLNITPDHLDRYEYKFENYVFSKFRIAQNQTPNDAFIYCCDDEAIMQYLEKANPAAKHYPFSIKKKLEAEGASLTENQITININQNPLIMTLEELSLQGKHNVYNSMASAIAARLVDVRKENVRESLSDFVNIEHRLEDVATINGIEFINDSKATNVNSVWYALESMKKPVVLIMGGVDKGNDYTQLYDLVKDKVKGIV
ncbi:MAG TPA: UDP-N-acetylmuramoyl-L-alanine--D-glutamate ligase, partial [Bacteroidia bacterium]|nr:UDP-N-acetylmuramoyl-L-alanine--D-glutamate ligase [Bacteroidia bacterium]